MKNLLKHFITGAIAFTLIATAAPALAIGISVGSVTGAPGEQVVVPVYLEDNDIALASLTIPLQYDSDAITIDSVTYGGTLLQPNMQGLTHIDNGENFIRITYVPTNSIPMITSTSGLLARIILTISPSALDQTIAIDSVNELTMIGEFELWVRPEMSDTLGATVILPTFEAGSVEIRSPLDVDDENGGLPHILALNQNYPNPFNPATTIAYSVPERSHVNLTIFNILGQHIETLVDDDKPAGEYEVIWNAGSVASGIYFYRLTYEDKVLTKKMTLLK
ncbi:MAG: cohesin domain-containing protein [Candidatus Zixiibacteriota bacterium]